MNVATCRPVFSWGSGWKVGEEKRERWFHVSVCLSGCACVCGTAIYSHQIAFWHAMLQLLQTISHSIASLAHPLLWLVVCVCGYVCMHVCAFFLNSHLVNFPQRMHFVLTALCYTDTPTHPYIYAFVCLVNNNLCVAFAESAFEGRLTLKYFTQSNAI